LAALSGALALPSSGLHASSYLLTDLGKDHGIVWPVRDDARGEPRLAREEVKALGTALAAWIASAAVVETLPRGRTQSWC
jgi:hypothetical protein